MRQGWSVTDIARTIALPVLLATLLAACTPPEPKLPGTREALRPDSAANAGGASPRPFALPPMTTSADWRHPTGVDGRLAAHAALSSDPRLAWSAEIGQGNGRRHRITADPVIADGRIFTLDSRSLVVATDLAGRRLWAADLTLPGEDPDDASGGGIAVSGGRVYVGSGFGALSVLNAASGDMIWQQRLGAPAAGAPAISGNLVYVTTRDSKGWALDLNSGRVVWQTLGAPSPAGRIGAAGPMTSGRAVIFPFGSGEVAAHFQRSGFQLWSAYALAARDTTGLSQINDITGAPVVAGNRVIVGNPAGRTAALDRITGDALWSAPFGAMSRVWVAGGSVFLISDNNALVRLDAGTGALIWKVDMPLFEKTRAKRRRDVFAHFGPVLAGGNLIVASDDGMMRFFDPETGALRATGELTGGAATNPVVAGGTMYIVTGDGVLRAFR